MSINNILTGKCLEDFEDSLIDLCWEAEKLALIEGTDKGHHVTFLDFWDLYIKYEDVYPVIGKKFYEILNSYKTIKNKQ